MEQIIAALILAGGAFFGVYKGAAYAVDRLAAQLAEGRRLSDERLEAEAKRLQMQLDAEATRLSRQLQHDREMRDLEEMRRKLDQIVADIRRIVNLTHNLEALGGVLRADSGGSWGLLEETRADLVDQYPALERDLNDRFLGLYLRLPPNHPITETLERFFGISSRMISVFRQKIQDVGDKELDEFFELRDQLSVVQASFMAASIALVGSKGAVDHYRQRQGSSGAPPTSTKV